MSLAKSYKYGKSEKLKSRKLIDELFSSGTSVVSYPFVMFFKAIDKSFDPKTTQVGVTVSKKKFGHAVDRNKIKRLMREAYRMEKYSLLENINTHIAIMIIYTPKKELELSFMKEKMNVALRKVSKMIPSEVDLP